MCESSTSSHPFLFWHAASSPGLYHRSLLPHNRLFSNPFSSPLSVDSLNPISTLQFATSLFLQSIMANSKDSQDLTEESKDQVSSELDSSSGQKKQKCRHRASVACASCRDRRIRVSTMSCCPTWVLTRAVCRSGGRVGMHSVQEIWHRMHHQERR